MQMLNLRLTDNPVGNKPLKGIYTALTRDYKSLGLTEANSVVLSCQPAAMSEIPTLKHILIEKNNDPNLRYEFYVVATDISVLIKQPLFKTAAEITKAKSYTNSSDLLGYIRTLTKHNLTDEDIWTNTTGIEYTGGTVPPNWYMEAQNSSMWYVGKLVLWLHPAP